MPHGVKYGGRQKGTPNKATKDIKAIAQQYTEQAIATLVDVMTNAKEAPARVAAANSLLDRGYGKPKQGLEVETPKDGAFVITREIVTRKV